MKYSLFSQLSSQDKEHYLFYFRHKEDFLYNLLWLPVILCFISIINIELGYMSSNLFFIIAHSVIGILCFSFFAYIGIIALRLNKELKAWLEWKDKQYNFKDEGSINKTMPLM